MRSASNRLKLAPVRNTDSIRAILLIGLVLILALRRRLCSSEWVAIFISGLPIQLSGYPAFYLLTIPAHGTGTNFSGFRKSPLFHQVVDMRPAKASGGFDFR